MLQWIQLCLHLTLSKSVFLKLPVLIPLVLYLICLVSAEVSLNFTSRIWFRCSFFWPSQNRYMVQLSHTWSDFSRLLRVMISETRILCHFILVYYYRLWWSSWHAMLALFLLHVFLVWIFSWCDLLQVTGTDASCVLYIICSQHITFEEVKLYCSYCAWFVALLASPYAALLHTCTYLFWLNLIVQFTSEFSLSHTDLCKVSTEVSDLVIS